MPRTKRYAAFCFLILGTLVAVLLCPVCRAQTGGALGVDVNADVDAFGHPQMDSAILRDYAARNTVYSLPLYNLPPGDSSHYWGSLAEQCDSAQIDFTAVWLKGNGQPKTFARLVQALNKRGLTGRVKVMGFDDNPASWTALWNFRHGDGYGYKTPFDVSHPEAWAFVWDANLKAFFSAVPDANRYKIAGRPVYAIWSGSPAFLSHLDGNGSKLIAYLRRQCRAEFGFNPYILVPQDWVRNDPSSAAPGVVDAVYPWFTPVPGPNYSTWNVSDWNGVTLGTCIPRFHISSRADPNAPIWIVDPDHGKTLAGGLAHTAGNPRCVSTFVEGFDDYWENAACWRARNLDENGKELGYAATGYDYPNQRINILRRFSRRPFPVDLKEEAENCDSFTGAAPFPGRPNFYRNGPIAIEDTTDTGGGWDVCRAQAGETLTWQEVPVQGRMHLAVRAAAAQGGRLHFVVDGKKFPAVRVPSTGGGQGWTTVDMGAYSFAPKTYHTVSLVWDTPNVSVNWWQVQAVKDVR